jgi:hypothetical protein
MLTYTDQQNLAKEISGLSDASSVIGFKRDINAGTARFLSKLDRPVDRQSKFTNSVANQQYYQIPEDSIRISYVVYLTGTNIWVPLQEIGDEATWRKMNAYPQTGTQPTHFFVRGGDEFGIYPTPSNSTADGIEVVFEPRHTLLTADDYTTGTVAATVNSQTVTGTGTTWNANMADGSYIFQVLDGSGNSSIRIIGYSSATSLTLENYYNGTTSVAATYRIGQVSKIPEEFQEAPVDYAMYRHFLGKGEMTNAKLFQQLWETSLKDAESTYGMSTSNQIVLDSGRVASRTPNPLLDSFDNQIRTS